MFYIMARNWWVLLVRGVIAILFGIAMLFSPGIALTILVLLWGVYALIDGISNIIIAFQGRTEHSNWWVTALEGLIGVVAGVLTFLWPGITALILLYIIAAWAIITGVLEITAAIQLRKEITGEFWLALSGIISILFGVLLIVAPGAGILSVLWLLAFYSILFGVTMVVLGFRVRHFGDNTGEPHARQMA